MTAEAPAAARRTTPPGLGYLAGFALIYLALHLLYHAVPDRVLADVVYRFGINTPAAWLIELLVPGTPVRVEGNSLLAPRVHLEVVRGCDGSGAFFIACAAMLAFRASWRARLAGVLLSFVTVFVLNEARVVALFFVVAHRPEWFTPLHTYFIPLVLVAAICAMFTVWARIATRPVAHG
ncbi:MAG: archaeosortase/exosortase family protein [Gammaproteobacteria bacterium]